MLNLASLSRVLYYILSTPPTDTCKPVPVVVGPPGSAKSTFTRLVGYALGCTPDRVVRWSLGNRRDMDLSGWGTKSDDGLRFEVPARLRMLNAHKEPALFILDEFLTASRQQFRASLQLLDSREMGDDVLGDHVNIVALTNDPDTSTGGGDLPLAPANRCIWINVAGPSKAEAATFARTKAAGQRVTIGDALPEPLTLDAWTAALRVVAGTWATWMERNADAVLDEYAVRPEVVLARFVTTTDERGGKVFLPAYATSRSWEMAYRCGATAYAHGDWDALRVIVCGAVGEPQGLAFLTALRSGDLVDPVEFIEAARRGKLADVWSGHDATRPDRTMQQLLNVVEYAASKSFEKRGDDRTWRKDADPREALAEWNAAWEGIKHALNTGCAPDAVAIAVQVLVKAQPPRAALRDHASVLPALQPVILAAVKAAAMQAKS